MTFLRRLPLQMRGLTKEHLADIVAKFEPCPENLQHMVLGIDGTYSTVHVSILQHPSANTAGVTLG